MPSGKVHDAITVIASAVTAPVWWLAAPPGWNDPGLIATLCGATLFSGLWLSPDLDLHSSVYRRWGLFRFFWWPYQKAMPHRSFLSHSLVLAPLVRIAYFVVVAFLLLRGVTWAANHFVAFDRNALTEGYAHSLVRLGETHPRYVALFFVGLLWGTALHVGADVLVSALKGRGRRRRRR